MSLLEVRDLRVSIGEIPILRGIDLEVNAGEVLGIIGESGSGKSMTALSIMRLLPRGAVATGSVVLAGADLSTKTEAEMNAVRGRDVGMVFQEPMTALDPLKTIGDQVAETIRIHTRTTNREARREADRVLDRVGLPADRFPRDRYPHELSGGQRQRVVIAAAIALRPKVLIADEPTTALDVTTQAQILVLLQRLVDEDGMGMILITHDLAVVAGNADRLAIMQGGAVVERGDTVAVFRDMQHPYTRMLFAASSHVPPRPAAPPIGDAPVLKVERVERSYRVAGRLLFSPPVVIPAVRGVSFIVRRGENVGLVGESGSGKSTLARAILALEPVQAGTIVLDGEPLTTGGGASFRARRKMQVVFQDPYGSFDPRHRVDRLITEPFHLLGAEAPTGDARRRAIAEALEHVGLSDSDAGKYIHEFSGGQRQRVAIARALIIRPALIVLDEAVSALDVSIRAQILDLLADLRDRLGLSYLFISHDLHVVRAITDRVLVMKAGEIVEQGPTEEVFRNPRHAYTQELIAAAPDVEKALRVREGK